MVGSSCCRVSMSCKLTPSSSRVWGGRLILQAEERSEGGWEGQAYSPQPVAQASVPPPTEVLPAYFSEFSCR